MTIDHRGVLIVTLLAFGRNHFWIQEELAPIELLMGASTSSWLQMNTNDHWSLSSAADALCDMISRSGTFRSVRTKPRALKLTIILIIQHSQSSPMHYNVIVFSACRVMRRCATNTGPQRFSHYNMMRCQCQCHKSHSKSHQHYQCKWISTVQTCPDFPPSVSYKSGLCL